MADEQLSVAAQFARLGFLQDMRKAAFDTNLSKRTVQIQQNMLAFLDRILEGAFTETPPKDRKTQEARLGLLQWAKGIVYGDDSVDLAKRNFNKGAVLGLSLIHI